MPTQEETAHGSRITGKSGRGLWVIVAGVLGAFILIGFLLLCTMLQRAIRASACVSAGISAEDCISYYEKLEELRSEKD